MTSERRRYFRIDETIGVYYSIIGVNQPLQRFEQTEETLELVSEQDQRIQALISELSDESPKLVELVSLFNQKLERIVNHLALDRSLVNRIAYRVREVNISACGVAFLNDEPMVVGTRLQMELHLLPGEKRIRTDGLVVSCDADSSGEYYWRIDFYSMSETSKEALIQHIVKRQAAQLYSQRNDS